MFDLESFLCPHTAKKHPEFSKERALATLALRRQWHLIFDDLPNVTQLMNDKVDAVFDEFLVWAKIRKLNMDWKLHLFMLYWLNTHTKWHALLKELHHREFILASLSRWGSNYIDNRNVVGMIVCSVFLETPLVLGMLKKIKYEESTKAEVLKVKNFSFSKAGIYTAKLSQYSYKGELLWHQLAH